MLYVWTELQFAAGFTFNTHRELSEWDIHTIRLASLYSHFYVRFITSPDFVFLFPFKLNAKLLQNDVSCQLPP